MNLLDGSPAESEMPTPYAVRCQGWGHPMACNPGGLVYLTEKCYSAQLSLPDSKWTCPRYGGLAEWDDENYEAYLDDTDQRPDEN